MTNQRWLRLPWAILFWILFAVTTLVSQATFAYDGHATLAAKETQTLFHYTNEKGLAGILESGELRPSLKALNPNDVRYGNGQYLSDIVPGTKSLSEKS